MKRNYEWLELDQVKEHQHGGWKRGKEREKRGKTKNAHVNDQPRKTEGIESTKVARRQT